MFDLIKKYPKIRGSLPKPLKKIFNNFYLENRENSLSQLLRRWMHLSMDDRETNKITLEIGSGNLNDFMSLRAPIIKTLLLNCGTPYSSALRAL